MRRVVTLLLAAGAALLVAGLIWPTDRLVVESPGGAVRPLLDIWVWGRVRSRSAESSTDLDGSIVSLAALGASAVVALVAAVLWARRRPGRAGARMSGVVAAVAVGVALVAAVIGLRSGDAAFGWVSMGGEPVFVRTVAAAFPMAALALWAVALVVMVVAVLRRGGAPGSESREAGEPAPS
ncbi:hypothetical protein [Terrabacter carboxydivorans]|uniref:Uncharacterized protein n=1 Tax=Terrabacter carboxydivorans TaxID=619730 RepID=A0ABP5YVV9_9MICO